MEFDIVPFDRERMMIGSAHRLYYMEIIVRILIIYLYAVVLLRITGNQGMKNMNFMDYFLVISLGSASGDAMFYPTVPIFYGLLTITIVILIKLFTDYIKRHNYFVLRAIEAAPTRLIYQGKIDTQKLDEKLMSKEEFFALLRIQGIRHTSTIEYCYVEPNGELSVYQTKDNEQYEGGESLIPPERVNK